MNAPETFEIFLIEDNIHDAQLLKIAFDKSDHHANLTHFVDGEAALDFLNQSGNRRPDLILMDLSLPKMNGMDFLRQIKSDAQLCNLKVVVLTGSRWDGDVRQVAAMKVSGYVVKPMDFAGLVSAVNNIGCFLKGTKTLPLKMEIE